MSDLPPTITLEIGELDKEAGRYPLRLFWHGESGLEEKARAEISQDRFDSKTIEAELKFEPIQTFLEEAGASSAFQETGQYLYDLLHQGDVATEWDKLKLAHARLRIQLDVKSKPVAAFPWELICDGPEKLAVDIEQTFLRTYHPEKPITKPKSESWPIRVLMVIGAKDDEDAILPWKEIRRIEAEIHKSDRLRHDNKLVHRMVDIEILRRPGLENLRKDYKEFKPHIFHFIGHGELEANADAHLVISYQDPDTKKYEEIPWTTAQIRTTFQGRDWLPRFVLINACRSEDQGAEDNRRHAWTIGDVFRKLGVPAVLTMQADVNGEAAGVFAGTLYKSLAELEPLDIAVANARIAISNFVKGLDRREWAIPVLTVAIPPEEILQLRPTATAERLLEIKDCAIFKEIDLFSDRTDQKRSLFRGFYPLPPQTANKDLIVVRGQQDAGKSWLARWCMEACALLNNDIRYVEVGGMETKTWLDVILQIRDGDDTKNSSLLINKPLKRAAFHKFNWELEHRLTGKEPPNVWDGTVVEPRKIKLSDPAANWPPNFEKNTLESFRQAIIQAAEINNPLIIVLDHFTKNAGITVPEMEHYLIPFLIAPAARRQFREVLSETESHSVKFVLVLNDDEFEKFKIGELVSGPYEVEAPLFKPEKFAELLAEYLRRIKPDWPEEKQAATVPALMNLFEDKSAFSFRDLNSIPGLKN